MLLYRDKPPWQKYDSEKSSTHFALKSTGSLDRLFVPWDEERVTLKYNCGGFTKNNVVHPCKFSFVTKENADDIRQRTEDLALLRSRFIVGGERRDFHQAMRRSRYLDRERHNPHERSDNEWRKAPTFSKANRGREARDYRIAKIPKGQKYPRLSLMGLPTEVRLVILEHLFSSLEIDSWSAGQGALLPLLRARFDKWNAVSNPLAILLTCRELYFEGHRIFQENTLFRSRLDQMPVTNHVQTTFLRLMGFGMYEWDDRMYQKMLPNVKRWHIQIQNPEWHCSGSRIHFVPNEYEDQIQGVIERQAAEVLRDENKLLELTVNLEAGNGRSSSMSNYLMKKYAIDALLAFTGNVKVMRITGEIPERLKKYARDTEIDIQGYDDTPPPPVVKKVESGDQESDEEL